MSDDKTLEVKTDEVTEPVIESITMTKKEYDILQNDLKARDKKVSEYRKDIDSIKKTIEMQKMTEEEKKVAERKEFEELKRELWREKTLRKVDLPEDAIEFLGGDDEESFLKRAEKLKEMINKNSDARANQIIQEKIKANIYAPKADGKAATLMDIEEARKEFAYLAKNSHKIDRKEYNARLQKANEALTNK